MTDEEIFNTDYVIIDILPSQVPQSSQGQYFAVERYFLKEQMDRIKQKHIDLILKLNCYMELTYGEEINPDPEIIVSDMKRSTVIIRRNDSLIVSEPDSTYLTLYNADEELLSLIKTLSVGEGLYVWSPPEG
ncbi:MAG: hypothetical protein K6F83_01830 [Clostridiales bacterium]|nr:hypothetical protein [Clostridiales bacterium]